MALEIADIGQDFRSSLAGMDPSAPRAASEVWRAFLEHASKPVRFDSPVDPDNDVIGFDVARPPDPSDRRLVKLQRRIGVETPELEYLGTIAAICYLEVPAAGAASPLPEAASIWGHGASAGAVEVQKFRSRVEESLAFRALMDDGVEKLVVSVSDL
jgi:hypothetical protein